MIMDIQPSRPTRSNLSALSDRPFGMTGARQTAQQLAFEALRGAIVGGALEPGTRLTQSDVAAQLSISTGPVREALRQLADSRLVRIDAHKGAIVRGLDREELQEIYELRLLLEPLSVRKAAVNITDAELDIAENLWDEMNDDSDIDAWVEANRNFHAVFARAARSPNLMQILTGLRDSSALYVRWAILLSPETTSRGNDDHRQLIDACRDGEADKAASIEENHLKSTLQAVMDGPALDGLSPRT